MFDIESTDNARLVATAAKRVAVTQFAMECESRGGADDLERALHARAFLAGQLNTAPLERRDDPPADPAEVERHRQYEEQLEADRKADEDYHDKRQHLRTDNSATVQAIRDAEHGVTRGSLSRRKLRPVSAVAPLSFDMDQLRQLHEACQNREFKTIRVKRDFSAVPSGIPVSQLWTTVIGPAYENRLLDRLPTAPMEAPGVTTYIRHTSTTGTPAITAQGATKPELVFGTDYVQAKALKLAAHTGIPDEVIADFGEFALYCQQEVVRQLVNEENRQLLLGHGTGGTTSDELLGFLNTPNILSHVTSSDTALDSIELSIAALRNGAQLAEPDLLVLNPLTWSAIRRSKDGQDRYLTQADPTQGEASSVWGVDVLVTTQITAGVGLLVDTTKFGRALIREPLNIRTGWTNDDYTSNLTRIIAEERLVLQLERPGAVLKITGLPTS
jgi:Phage capsid family